MSQIDIIEDQEYESKGKQFYTVIEEITEEQDENHQNQLTSDYLHSLLLGSKSNGYLTEGLSRTVDNITVTTSCDVNKTKLRKYPALLKQNIKSSTWSGDTRRYPCGYPGCEWVFTRTNHVVRHHERVHPGFKAKPCLKDKKSYACTVCKQVLASPALLKNHLSFHRLNTGNRDNISLTIESSDEHSEDLEDTNNHPISLVRSEQTISSQVEVSEWNDTNDTITSTTKSSISSISSISSSSSDSNIISDKSLLRNTSDNVFASSYKLLRPFACTLPGCDKTYTKNSHLMRHLTETHKISKPLPCKINPKISTSIECLSTELNSDERPFACNYPGCGWTFKRQYHLNRHIITHKIGFTDWNKSYICDYPGCDETFTDESLLMEHYLIHSGPSNDTDDNTFEPPPVECVLQELNDEEIKKKSFLKNIGLSENDKMRVKLM